MSPGRVATPESGGAVNWNQTNWAFAHASMFASELVGHGPSEPAARVPRGWAGELAKRQEGSGGWGHGPGGKNGLGYIELNIMASLSMLAMGMTKQTGWAPPADTIEKARKYLQDSSGDDG